MTVNRVLPERREWKCDQCGDVGIWGPTWWAGGSLLLEDLSPDDVPTLCSDECMKEFDRRMKSGDVEVPTVRMRGDAVKLSGKRKGY